MLSVRKERTLFLSFESISLDEGLDRIAYHHTHDVIVEERPLIIHPSRQPCQQGNMPMAKLEAIGDTLAHVTVHFGCDREPDLASLVEGANLADAILHHRYRGLREARGGVRPQIVQHLREQPHASVKAAAQNEEAQEAEFGVPLRWHVREEEERELDGAREDGVALDCKGMQGQTQAPVSVVWREGQSDGRHSFIACAKKSNSPRRQRELLRSALVQGFGCVFRYVFVHVEGLARVVHGRPLEVG